MMTSEECSEKGVEMAPMMFEDTVSAVERTLDILLRWIGRFDAKAAFVFGIGTAMLGVLAPVSSLTEVQPLETYALVLTSGIVVSASLLLTYLATFPQIKGPSRSLLFFWTIARYSRDEYRETVLRRTPTEYLADLISQCHRNAEILRKKFERLRLSYILLFFGVILWTISLYVLQI